MRRISTILFTIFLSATVFSQPVLTFENHALKDGIDNPMTLCEFADPGMAGADIEWDFSELITKKQFTGHINNSFEPRFSDANTVLEEFGSSFFFNIDKESIKQVGFLSKNGKTSIEYTEPFVKMKYPMEFTSFYTKGFNGIYKVDNKQIGEITGTGTIEADAWGTLILPKNSVYENTLRVKTSKIYKTVYSNSEFDIEITTYRWYNDLHRYPLLVLTEYKTISNNKEYINYQAAYNNNAVSSIDSPGYTADVDISVYPNPTENVLNVDFPSKKSGKAHITIFDITGKKAFIQSDYEIYQGDNSISLNNEIATLKPGQYLLQVTMNNQTVVREFTLID